MVNIQTIVTKYRTERSLTLNAFAEAIDVTHPTIRNWEIGATKPDKYFLLALTMRYSDWRRDFALECIQASYPAYLEAAEMQKVI